jgi:hypothetical protein
MSEPITLPMTHAQVVDTYFLEHRAKLLDVAAFLDRIDRARQDGQVGGDETHEDFRLEAFRRALEILCDDGPERARRVLEVFSDPTSDPIAAAPMQGATGAYQPLGR